MTEIEINPKARKDFLLGLSLVELMLILFFFSALLFAIGLQLRAMSNATQPNELASCDITPDNTDSTLALQASKSSELLASCENELFAQQTSHETSESTVLEQLGVIESLRQERLVLMQTVEDLPVLAGASTQASDEEKQLSQLITLLTEKELYADSALSSVKDIIQENERLSREVEKKTEVPNLCEISIEDAAEQATKETAHSELQSNFSTLQDDHKDCVVRLERQRTRNRLDYPACWEIANGQPDYIFNVTLTDAGYDVLKAYPSTRDARASKIPGVLDMQGESLSVDEFSTRADKIFTWSKERNCRHYVRIFDGKDASDETRKKRLKDLQTYFYIFKP